MQKSLAVYSIAIFSLLSIYACQYNQEESTIKTDTPQQNNSPATINTAAAATAEDAPYFKASGTEPFWGLTISASGIKFTSINQFNDSFISPLVEPTRVADANIKIYKLQTESGDLDIEIAQTLCINAMSGDSSPYKVTIVLKKGTGSEVTEFDGCGKYVTDTLLNGKWILQKLLSNNVGNKDFTNDVLFLNINVKDNSFSGYAGCNNINGLLFFEKGILRFTKVTTTRKMCGEENKENIFLKALNSSISYQIENNDLIISNPSGVQAVFKKG